MDFIKKGVSAALFGIILFLLKCIGILLLAIIGIILLVVLTVLFSPICYKAKGEKIDTLCGDFQIKWIFGLVSVSGALQEGQETPTLDICIFGKSLTQNKKQKTRKKKKQPDILYTRENTQKETQTPPRSVAQQKLPEPPTKKTEPIPTEEIHKAEPQSMQKKQGIRRVKLEDIQETPPPDIKDTQQTKSQSIYDTKNSTKSNADTVGMDWKAIVKMALAYDQKKAFAKAIWRFVKGLTKTILPNQLYFKGTFGTGDPVHTGYLLAMAGILKSKFGKNLDIKGDFAKATAENIVFRLKGHIVLGHLAYLAARFALSKPVRHIIILLWKGRK